MGLPCIIMGFVPHEEVVRLLLDLDRKHPYPIRKGTFIIRVSESRPGCLVITYKVRDNSNELNSVQIEVLEDGGVTLEVRSGLVNYSNLEELLVKVPVLTTLYPNFSVKNLFRMTVLFICIYKLTPTFILLFIGPLYFEFKL